MMEFRIAAEGAAFAATLAVVAVEDIRSRRIPDGAVAAGLLLSVAFSPGLEASAVGAFAGFGLFAFVRWVRPGGIGGGDLKLASYLGSVLGPWWLWVAVGAASILALLFFWACYLTGRIGREEPIPYAPFLAAGGLLAWCIGMQGVLPRGIE